MDEDAPRPVIEILKSRFIPKVDQPENPLFTNGPNTNLNACVGTNGKRKDLYDYGRGFIEAGDAIVRAAEDRLMFVDLSIYPAAFSYRHGVELLLKHLIGVLGAVIGARVQPPKNHGIDKMIAQVLAMNAKIAEPLMEKGAPERVAELIGYFHDIDATNQVFRYPIGTKDEQHLADYKLINIDVLRTYMGELSGLMSRWIDQAERRCRDNAEAHGYE